MNNHHQTLPGDEEAAARFRAFIAEVEDILQTLPDSLGAGLGDAGGPFDRTSAPAVHDAAPALDDPDEAALRTQRRLRTLIDMQDLQAAQDGGRATPGQLNQQRYLKAALADELLLSRPWVGQSAWPRHLLETSLFGTSVAGDKLLDDIAQLLQTRETVQRPLGRLYLWALALGFQGRLRGQQDLSLLQSLGLQLYHFVYQRQPSIESGQALLSPQAYAHTVSQASERRRRFSRWTLRWSLSLVALLVLSQALWFWQTWPLRQALTGTGSGVMAEGAGVPR